MSILGTIGLGIAKQAGGAIAQQAGQQIGYGIGEITGYNEKLRQDQLKQQQALTNQQVVANKDLADYTSGLQRQMYDYTFDKENKYNSPVEQIKRLREAGLNPALAYGLGAEGAGGTTGSASAGSAGGGSASNETQRKMADLAQQQQAMQIERQKVEIDNIKADTDNKRKDLDVKDKDIELKNKTMLEIGEKIENYKVDRQLKEVEKKMKENEAEIAEATKGYQIEQASQNLNLTKKQVAKTIEEIDAIIASKEKTNEEAETIRKTRRLIIEKYNQEISGMYLQGLKTMAETNNIRLNYEKIEAEIANINERTTTSEIENTIKKNITDGARDDENFVKYVVRWSKGVLDNVMTGNILQIMK